jgi:hypothetical protein
MLPELEPYIARYYDKWLNYSQYICTRLGIRREAYDIMADVLVEFCCKSDESLSDLLAYEQRGECKLLMCIIKAIRFRAVDFIRQKRAVSCDIEKHVYHLSAPDNDDLQAEISNEMREAEAMFRDDSLVIPVATSTKTTISRGVWFSGYIYKRSCPEKARLRIVYRAHIYARGKQLKQLARPTRSEAMAAMLQYQMQHTI